MAKKKTAAKSKAAGNKKTNKTIMPALLAGSLAICFLIKQAAIFLLLAMLPAIVSFATDRDPRKQAFWVIFACNLAGAVPYLFDIIKQNLAMQAVQNTIGDPRVWFTVFSAAGFGWVLNFIAPRMAKLVVEMLHEGKIDSSRNAQKKLIEEWGSEVKFGKE